MSAFHSPHQYTRLITSLFSHKTQCACFTGFSLCPPVYPTCVEITPGTLWNASSTPQKHPAAKVASSVLAAAEGVTLRATMRAAASPNGFPAAFPIIAVVNDSAKGLVTAAAVAKTRVRDKSPTPICGTCARKSIQKVSEKYLWNELEELCAVKMEMRRGVWWSVVMMVCIWQGSVAWTRNGVLHAQQHATQCAMSARGSMPVAHRRSASLHRIGYARACTALRLQMEMLDPATVDLSQPTPLVDELEESLPADPEQKKTLTEVASETIDTVITLLLEQKRRNLPFDESALVENAPELTKNELYEMIMSNRMSQANATEHGLLQQVDAFMQGFVITERTKRLDMKIEMLIMFGLSGTLEPAMEQMREMHELDRPLLVRVRQKISELEQIKKNQQLNETMLQSSAFFANISTSASGRVGMDLIAEELNRAITAQKDDTASSSSSDSPTSLVDEVLRKRDVMSLLQTLEHRIEMEIRLLDRWDVHLLGSLLKSTHEEMVVTFTMRLRRIEQVEVFERFLEEVLETMREVPQLVGRRTPYTQPVKLAPETYERVKAVKMAFDEFKKAKQPRYMYDSGWTLGGSNLDGPLAGEPKPFPPAAASTPEASP